MIHDVAYEYSSSAAQCTVKKKLIVKFLFNVKTFVQLNIMERLMIGRIIIKEKNSSLIYGEKNIFLEFQITAIKM